jgi:hypothetical protein
MNKNLQITLGLLTGFVFGAIIGGGSFFLVQRYINQPTFTTAMSPGVNFSQKESGNQSNYLLSPGQQYFEIDMQDLLNQIQAGIDSGKITSEEGEQILRSIQNGTLNQGTDSAI